MHECSAKASHGQIEMMNIVQSIRTNEIRLHGACFSEDYRVRLCANGILFGWLRIECREHNP